MMVDIYEIFCSLEQFLSDQKGHIVLGLQFHENDMEKRLLTQIVN
jgi:hypothetical protein